MAEPGHLGSGLRVASSQFRGSQFLKKADLQLATRHWQLKSTSAWRGGETGDASPGRTVPASPCVLVVVDGRPGMLEIVDTTRYAGSWGSPIKLNLTPPPT